jgi:hypothetical protein
VRSGRGRPRNRDKGSALSFRMPTALHDELCRLALARQVPVSALARQWLIICIRKNQSLPSGCYGGVVSVQQPHG